MSKSVKINKGVQEAITICTSQTALAEKCKVSQVAVRKWLLQNCPAERAIQIEKVTGVSRAKTRPDLFEEKE